jgi:hypothetical protein
LGERPSDQVVVNGVVYDVEKADVPAGGADFSPDFDKRGPIAFTP